MALTRAVTAKLIENSAGKDVMGRIASWRSNIFAELRTMNPDLQLAEYMKTGQVPLHMLPYDRRVAAMGEYRDIIGLDKFLNELGKVKSKKRIPRQVREAYGVHAEQVHNIQQALREIKGFDAEAPLYKVASSFVPGENPVLAIYAGLNLQLDKRFRGVRAGVIEGAQTAASFFGIGTGVIDPIPESSLSMTSNLINGKRFLSFDLETAGLMKGQIREVGYSAGIIGGAAPNPTRLLFDAPAFRRGSLGVRRGRKIGSASLFDASRIGEITPISTDFAERMTPFLHEMTQSDYIIGHNIASFDIPQVYSQLIGTKAYQSDINGFRRLVDTAFKDIDSKIVDTLTLAQRSENLVGLKTDRALLQRGQGTVYSIENLLLQTDLGARLNKDMGGGFYDLLAREGLHGASVDDEVTRGLLRHMSSLRIRELKHVGARQAILRSAAMTPFTNARMQEQVSDIALKHLIANVPGGIHVPIGRNASDKARQLHAILSSDDLGSNPVKVKQAFDLIRNGNIDGLDFKINPIEQQIFEQRRLGTHVVQLPKSVDAEAYLFRSRDTFDTGIKTGAVNSEMSPADFARFQKGLAGSKIPFAGLSFEERNFGTALSHITASIDPARASIQSLVSDLMVSSFEAFKPKNVAYVTASGRQSFPIALLNGRIKQGSLLDLSIVQATSKSPQRGVNLVHRFGSQSEVDDFADYLTRLRGEEDTVLARHLGVPLAFDESQILAGKQLSDDELGFVSDAIKPFKEGVTDGIIADLRANGLERGVSVGQVYGDKAEEVIGLLERVNGGELRDTERLPFRLPFLSTLPSREGDNVVRVGGAVFDRGLTNRDVRAVQRSTKQVGEILNAFLDLRFENPRAIAAAKMAAWVGTEKGIARVEKAYRVYEKIRPHSASIVVGALAVAFGVHEWNKYQENEPYREVFEQQPLELDRKRNVAFLLEQKKLMGIDLSRQGYNPLDTAFVVDNLDSNKIGHTNMSKDKNASLYGGFI